MSTIRREALEARQGIGEPPNNRLDVTRIRWDDADASNVFQRDVSKSRAAPQG